MPFSSHSYSLHMIFSPNGWLQAQSMVAPDDRVLFLQDSVYLLQSELNSPSPLLYARALDINARRINLSAQADKGVDIEAIEDELWVQLTEHAKNIISW